jgi:WhiB family redox-sensing transcriptional regulator
MPIMTEPRLSPNWRDAACLEQDPELFFPIGKPGPAAKRKSDPIAQQIAMAKAVCGTCCLAEVCLRYALTTEEQFGIWGGQTEDERRALLRRAERARSAA